MFTTLRSRITLLTTVIVGAILALFSTLMINWEYQREVSVAQERQDTSLELAAALLKSEFDGVSADFAADGTVERIVWNETPALDDHSFIDMVGASTGETATVFVFNPDDGDFWRFSTNIVKPDGSRAVGTPLGVNGAVHPVIMRGEVYKGEANILGKDYLTVYFPVYDLNDSISGILYVGVSQEALNAVVINSTLQYGGMSLVMVLAAGLMAYWLLGRSLKGVASVREALDRLADRDYATELAGADGKDEIGQIARAVEATRQALAENETERAQHSDIERIQADKTAEMLQTLDEQVGSVVSSAVGGDFSHRVEGNFEQPEIHRLASGVNNICETVDKFLSDILDVARSVADGDLGRQMSDSHEGAFNDVAQSINQSFQQLSGSMQSVSGAAQSILTASEAINSGSHQLSNRSNEQASSLEETAATMEEMSATIKSNAEGAQQAADIAEGANGTATEGQRVVSEAVAAMNRIKQSAGQISEITTVIEAIAFQTNLLALNAAVEAARAGESGKGFAVVASEVRGLAQRSSQATQDITKLIDESSSHVNEGVRLVEASGDSMTNIVEAIAKMSSSIQEISRVSAEQAEGVEEISSAINNLDKMTQETASIAENSLSAARNLQRDGKSLNDTVSKFQLEGGAASDPYAMSA